MSALDLHCPACGKPRFGRVETIIVDRLQSAQRPLPVEDLIAGAHVDRASWVVIRNRLNRELEPLCLAIVNAAGQGPWRARYRLEPVKGQGE